MCVTTALVGLGAALGWVAPWVVGWALTLPWLPVKGPLMILDQLETHFGGWLLIVVGAVAGLVVDSSPSPTPPRPKSPPATSRS